MDYCKTFGDYSMVFCNSVKSTRNGFKHVCDWTLYQYNVPIRHGVNNAYYINRTWETYTFRTVMKQAVFEVRGNIKEEIKREYKKDNNLKHTGSKSEKAIEELWNRDGRIEALKEIYNQL